MFVNLFIHEKRREMGKNVKNAFFKFKNRNFLYLGCLLWKLCIDSAYFIRREIFWRSAFQFHFLVIVLAERTAAHALVKNVVFGF